jgi:hypothetical protein
MRCNTTFDPLVMNQILKSTLWRLTLQVNFMPEAGLGRSKVRAKRRTLRLCHSATVGAVVLNRRPQGLSQSLPSASACQATTS